ncbi:uncharacterized protein LY89DRAFT_664483 [Mollisia scopiformis]|uniref:Ribosome biogenesis protein SLX9 n=1 Tax=Mollisia scopiformis TaxID=149040 RepID=A0A194XQX2_MOLSC|nr:uncharacterized protein LY89DRAFT_664483 [Mollisia scopiformis]KUJ22685.1 hypothetical protein LY89DRAFT_664483 [Mollisia scopiformis]
MAPTAPKKRPSIRTKTSKTSNSGSGMIARPPPAHREGAIISDSFINSKKDKRTIKHSAFVNRIEKAHRQPLKRRRPNKKLKTTMEGLADALPDVEALIQGKINGEGKIKMKSLRSKPGALKRKEKLERVERERFGKNMAQIMGVKEQVPDAVPAAVMEVEGDAATAPVQNATSNRFAALRAWVNTNMEKNPAFEKASN